MHARVTARWARSAAVRAVVIAGVMVGLSAPFARTGPAQDRAPELGLFYLTASADTQADALRRLDDGWQQGYSMILWDIARFLSPDRRQRIGWQQGYSMILWDIARFLSPDRRQRIVDFLEEQSGQRFGHNMEAWHRWLWELPYDPHPEYALFKNVLYGQLDPRFKAFLRRRPNLSSGSMRSTGAESRSTVFHLWSTRRI